MKIVHDYLIQMGGAERVVDVMVQAFPDSEIYTSVTDYRSLISGLQDKSIKNSWMQKIPFVSALHKKLFFLYPFAFSTLPEISDDLVWLSSSGYSKWAHFSPDTPVFAYIHTPPRFFWDNENYLRYEINNKILRSMVGPVLNEMRKSDYKQAQKMTFIVANSKCVQERIWRCYKRESVVIHPPVEVDKFQKSQVEEEYYLVVSRLVGYKAIDIAVQACTKSNAKLVVIGDGPDKERLKKMAGKSVRFLGRVSDETVKKFMENCLALIFPGYEDFGITPVEAQACGKPVIAYRAGGALETVIEGKTGLFFDENNAEDLIRVMKVLERMSWNKDEIHKNAIRFSKEKFLDATIDDFKDRANIVV
jgi:glycosyltransferase involved in cell wall biosynthesis